MKRGLILFAHGARDPQWAKPFERLAARVRTQRPDLHVALAYLDLMSPRLPESVATLAESGCERIAVVPIFLGQGGHVLRDLPLQVEQLRQRFPQLTMEIARAAGEDDAVLDAIAGYCIGTLAG